MKIGLLQCDHVQEQFVHQHGNYPQMFSNWLQQAKMDFSFITYEAIKEQLPTDPHEADAYLISGSRHGVNDGHPWIAQLENVVREFHDLGKKIIGICFGHQLIAKALGGKVLRSPNGWGIGMSVNQVLRPKPWMTPQQEQFHLLVSHQDQVIELPFGAEVIAGSAFCPFYMLQVKHNLLTVQGHPEFTKAYSKALIEQRQQFLGKEKAEIGLNSLKLNADDRILAQWTVNFLLS
nr:GMP synthase [Legionella jordanis]